MKNEGLPDIFGALRAHGSRDRELHRQKAGELSEESTAGGDSDLGAQRREVDADFEAFRLKIPFERFAMEQETRLEAERPAFLRLLSKLSRLPLMPMAAAAAATVALAVLVPALLPVELEHTTSSIRLKGGSRIGYFVKRPGSAELGVDGQALHPGDFIQFAVHDVPGARSFVLLGIDGRGVVSTYVATDIQSTQTKGPTRPRLLPSAMKLDDSLGAERFFAVYGPGPIGALKEETEKAAGRVVASKSDLVQTGVLPLPESYGYSQSSVHIVKLAR